MERIIEQLTEYCECVKGFNTKDITELITYVSMATCWDKGGCGNDCPSFLQGSRREVIDLPDCMDCVYEFTPIYRPFVLESVSFTLVKIDGIEETNTPIASFAYSTTDCKFRIDTGLPGCNCKCKVCGCEPKYKLVVDYEAGYEEIPDCLLPAFCNLLEVIHAKNDCCCNTECACESTENNVKYATGDVTTVQIDTDFGQMIAKLTSEMLGTMSVCKLDHEIWAVIA